jgi:hypothetical protein
MTIEEIEAKALELGIKYNCKVVPIALEDDVVGFLKEPPRFVKMRFLDKMTAQQSSISTMAELLDAYLIKEDSDIRIYSEAPENDKYYFGATMAAIDFIKVQPSILKKK